MNTRAQDAFNAAFNVPRDRRSQAYKLGALTLLTRKLDGGDPLRCPFEEGSAESDAWHAGVDEGHSIVRRVRETDDALTMGELKRVASLLPALRASDVPA